jgi:hypothetical protein
MSLGLVQSNQGILPNPWASMTTPNAEMQADTDRQCYQHNFFSKYFWDDIRHLWGLNRFSKIFEGISKST